MSMLSVRFSSTGYMVEIQINSTQIETSIIQDCCESKVDHTGRKSYNTSSSTVSELLP